VRGASAFIAHALALVDSGGSLHKAAAAIGTTHITVMRWRRRGAGRQLEIVAELVDCQVGVSKLCRAVSRPLDVMSFET
jgi:hypothetical protein